MLDIPNWLKKSVGKYYCPFCEKENLAIPMKAENIVGLGVRMSSKYEDKSVFFFEHSCKTCVKNCFIELDFMNLEDFVMIMLDEYTDPEGLKDDIKKRTPDARRKMYGDPPSNSKGSKSRISTEEVAAMAEVLEKCKNWDEILLNIGMSEDEIEKHKKEGLEEFRLRLKEKDQEKKEPKKDKNE